MDEMQEDTGPGDEDVPDDLRPYYDGCFILGAGICDGCHRQQPFDSTHPEFSVGWWVDEARAMKEAGWVVPDPTDPLEVFCPECAARPGMSR